MKHIDYYRQIILGGGSASGGGGGITPTGTIQITENGQHDVTQYATADVNVPNPSAGTLELDYGELEFGQTVDETQDVTDKAEVHIAVFAKEPSGTLDISDNGTKDVTEYASVNVQVPNPSTGTKEISVTENGTITEDVTDFASVEITTNVAGSGGIKDYLEGTVTVIDDESVTELRDYALAGIYNDFTVHLPNVETVGLSAFATSYGLKNITLEKLVGGGGSIFKSCDDLASADLPEFVGDSSSTNSMFSGCSKLETVNLPKLERLEYSCFEGCSAIKKIKLPSLKYLMYGAFGTNKYRFPEALRVFDVLLDDGTKPSSFQATEVFNYSENLMVVIRTELGVASLNTSPVANETLTFYVPDALVESYKTATNWSKYAEQIHPLSEYVEPEV